MRINILNIPVFYINLKRDVQKNKETLEILKAAGFTNINRFDAILGGAKKDGCAKSHQQLLKELEIDGPFIVFEDDIEITNDFNPVIDIPEDSHAVYLGLSKFGLSNGKTDKEIVAEKINDDIYRIYNMLAAHAILYLKKDYYKFLSHAIQAMLDEDRNQDNARAETMRYFKIYALNKPLFYQGGKHKDVTKFHLDTIKPSLYHKNSKTAKEVKDKSARSIKRTETLLSKEFLKNPPNVAIIILSWKRQANVKNLMTSLSQQTYKNFSVHISNGMPEINGRLEGWAKSLRLSYGMDITVRKDDNKLFAFRRLLVAKELAEAGADIIMYIDDDVSIPQDYVETCLSQYEPETYASGFAWSLFDNGKDYYKSRTRQHSNVYKVHYCGTGISMVDAKIFLHDELTNLEKVPGGAIKIEDLWLSFIAQHRLKWKLKYLSMPGVILGGGDGVALYKQVSSGSYDKADFLRDLVKMGWKIPKSIVKA